MLHRLLRAVHSSKFFLDDFVRLKVLWNAAINTGELAHFDLSILDRVDTLGVALTHDSAR